MNIWIMNPFDAFPGESLRPGRYAFLSQMLADMGHGVTWWSSNFCHATKSLRSEKQTSIGVSDNLCVVLLKTPRYDKNISLQRIWNHYVYARALRAEGLRCQEAPDVIIASSPPLMAANTAIASAKRLGAKSILDIQDLWPEAFEMAFPGELQPIARVCLLPLRRLADRVYDRADAITAVSNTYLQRGLSASGDKSKPSMMLPLGVDLSLYDNYLRQPVDMPYVKDNKSEFWAVYIGTIGKSYDIETLLEAAGKSIRSYPSIKFVIAGAGPDYAKMVDRAGKNGLTNVTFTGLLSYHQVVHLLSQSDVGINAIIAASRTSLPNKPFDYIAAGLPIISSVKGELEGLIRDEGIGLQYEAGNADSLAKAIIELHDNPQGRLEMGQTARKLAEERFDMNKEYPKFEEFLHKVVSKSGQGSSQT
jgi:glycosyltransferase involved in cell wall biosynthesis